MQVTEVINQIEARIRLDQETVKHLRACLKTDAGPSLLGVEHAWEKVKLDAAPAVNLPGGLKRLPTEVGATACPPIDLTPGIKETRLVKLIRGVLPEMGETFTVRDVATRLGRTPQGIIPTIQCMEASGLIKMVKAHAGPNPARYTLAHKNAVAVAAAASAPPVESRLNRGVVAMPPKEKRVESELALHMRRVIREWPTEQEWTRDDMVKTLRTISGDRTVNGWIESGAIATQLTYWRDHDVIAYLRRMSAPSNLAVFKRGPLFDA